MGVSVGKDVKRRWTALVHVAKTELGLSDEDYRALLHGAAGVWSAAELRDARQFDAVMDAFEHFGFRPSRVGGKPSAAACPRQEWGCTSKQQAKIWAMWKSIARRPTPEALRAFVKRVAKVDALRFLDVSGAQKVILALEAMALQTGERQMEAGAACQTSM